MTARRRHEDVSLADVAAEDLDEVLDTVLLRTSRARWAVAGGPEVDEDLRLAVEAVDRARDLAARVLTLSGGRRSRPQRLELPLALLGLRDRLERLLGRAIDLQPDALPSAQVDVDPALLTQVVVELTTNALHALDEIGWITIGVRTASLADGRPAVAVVIRDTGRGMDAHELGICQAALAGSDAGDALGLAVAGRAIELLGGEISIESEPGHGTTATALLPLV